MTAIGIIIFVVAWLALFAASIWLVVAAFRVSVGWGLASLFIPFAGFVFPFLHWEKGGKPFIAVLCCLPPLVVGTILFILGIVPANNEGSSPRAETVSRPALQFEGSTGDAPVDFSSSSAVEDNNLSRGDVYTPISPMTLLPTIRYSEGDIVQSEFRGTETGTRFNDRAPSGGFLVGLRIGVDDRFGSILNIRSIFQVGNRCTYGEIHGPSGGQPHEIVGKPGFAIGGLLLTTSISIRSIQAIFLRVNNIGQLDPSDRYDSNIVGHESGRKRRIFAGERPVVEIHGWTSDKLQALGLSAIGASANAKELELAQTSPSRELPNANPFSDSIPKSTPKNEPDVPLVSSSEKPLPDEPTAEINPPAENNSEPQAESKPKPEPDVPTGEPFRNWSSAGGGFSVSAKFKSIDGKDVLLENRDGKNVRIAIDKLSSADQDYIKSRQDR